VQVNPEREKERAVPGAELVPEKFKIIRVAQHSRRAGFPVIGHSGVLTDGT
jgi:hypothetical protein